MGCIPERIQRSRAYETFQKVTRVLQFLSATISLGLFSRRLYRVVRAFRQADRSYGAVEGILAAGVLYTLIMMISKFCLRHGAPSILRWIMIVFDILFVGGFIAVAVLTRPNGGPSGPCPRYQGTPLVPESYPLNCNLPWGTFILAIVSTFLHALTAIFHEARKHYRQHKLDHEMARKHHSHSSYGSYDAYNHHDRRGHHSHHGHHGHHGHRPRTHY